MQLRRALPEITARTLAAIRAPAPGHSPPVGPPPGTHEAVELEREIGIVLEAVIDGVTPLSVAQRGAFEDLIPQRHEHGVARPALLNHVHLATAAVLEVAERLVQESPPTRALEAAHQVIRRTALAVQDGIILAIAGTGPALLSPSDFFAHLLVGGHLAPEDALGRSASKVGLSLRDERVVLLVTDLRRHALGQGAALAAASQIATRFQDAVEIPGSALGHVVLVLPLRSQEDRASKLFEAERIARVRGVHILVSSAAFGGHDLREAYRDTATLLPLLYRICGPSHLVLFDKHRGLWSCADLSGEVRRGLVTAHLGGLMDLLPAQRNRFIATIRVLGANAGNQKAAARELGRKPRTIRERKEAMSALIPRAIEDGEMYIAACCYEWEIMAVEPSTETGAHQGGSLTDGEDEEDLDDPRMFAVPGLLERVGIQVKLRTYPREILGSLPPGEWHAMRLRDLPWRRVAMATAKLGRDAAGSAIERAVSVIRDLRDHHGGGSGLGVLALLLALKRPWRRLARSASRWRAVSPNPALELSLAQQPAMGLAMALVLVLSVGAVPGVAQPFTSPPGHSSDRHPEAPPPSGPGGQSAVGANLLGAVSVSGRLLKYTSPPGGTPGRVLPPASSETPSDSHISAATPSPNYPTDHTILAIGSGNTCLCPVLFRSRDGGASWHAAPGPAQGTQIVLPPAYPSDPAIFIGNPADSGALDSMSPGFGSTFNTLAIPPGRLAISPAFDRGSPVIYTSALGGVWSANVKSGDVRPMLVDPTVSTASAIASPPAGDGHALFILTSWTAVPFGVPTDPSQVAAAATKAEVVSCSTAGLCTTAGRPDLLSIGGLAVSPGYGRASLLAAYGGASLLVSTNDGEDFRQVHLPDTALGVKSVAIGSAPGMDTTVWALLRGQQEEFVAKIGWGSSRFELAAPATDPNASVGGFLVALSPTRVVHVLPGVGLLCTADGGQSWQAGCPTERG